MMFLLRRIKNKTLCHAELVSASQDVETQPHGGQAHKAHTSPARFVKRVQGDMKSKLSLKKAFAFTLAETLIVMGIIGVVAALTIPNLNSSTADKEKVAKLQKIYSNLNDAFGRAEAVYGPVDEWFQPSDSTEAKKAERVGERIVDFMKTSKNCKMENTTACGGWGTLNNQYKFITADGTSVVIYVDDLDISLIYFACDIDGPSKGANRDGLDQFYFVIRSSSIQPMGYDSMTSPLTSCAGGGGSYCATWVIQNGNMDYLKMGNDGKCPNGKVLDWTTNTSCK